MNKILNAKNVMIFLSVLYIITTIPILVMAFYSGPLWDDFESSAIFHELIKNHRYLLAILVPIGNSIYMFFSWQGTYFAEFLFVLQPGAWPIPAYWFNTFLIVGAVSFSYIFLWSTLAEMVFRSKKHYGTIIALLMLILQFQKVPYIHQAFYWYNGAIYYSFFLALYITEIALVIRLLYSRNSFTKKKRNLLALLAFMVSGGNYSIALINCIVLLLFLIYARSLNEKNKFKSIRLILIVAFIGLAISMFAPGNAVRAAGETGMSATKAIYHSIIYAVKTIMMWMRPLQVAMLLLMMPVVYHLVKDSKIKFKYPGIALIIMFGLYTAQMAPPYYGLSSPGAERQIDMYYYTFHLLITGCLVYIEGWLLSRYAGISNFLSAKKTTIIIIFSAFLIFLIAITKQEVSDFNSVKIADDILSGRAAQYAKEYALITEKLASEDEICQVQDINQWTYSLDSFEIDEDPMHWINRGLARYYGCEQIIKTDNLSGN